MPTSTGDSAIKATRWLLTVTEGLQGPRHTAVHQLDVSVRREETPKSDTVEKVTKTLGTQAVHGVIIG